MNCNICGGEMWDNRAKKTEGKISPKAPDFKCKDPNCNGVKWPPKNTTPQQVSTYTAQPSWSSAPVPSKSEEKVDWAAKERQSMAQTAMKSASEIVAALISLGKEQWDSNTAQSTTKQMANEFYKELLRMKNLEE